MCNFQFFPKPFHYEKNFALKKNILLLNGSSMSRELKKNKRKATASAFLEALMYFQSYMVPPPLSYVFLSSKKVLGIKVLIKE